MARRIKKPRTPAAAGAPARALRRVGDEFHEWRYEPGASKNEYLNVALVSAGGLALGIGVYALFLRDEAAEPIPYAPYVLALGVVLVAAYVLLGRRAAAPVRVGELGVGFEDEGKISRTRWYEVERVVLSDGMLRLMTAGKPLSLPLSSYAGAARRIVAEATKRIPKRVELDDVEVDRIGAPRASEGEKLSAEPPQVTQQRCRASERVLTFEKDVRLCSRCGALYHRAEIPRRCLECGKKLKSA